MSTVKPQRAWREDGSPSNWERYLDLLQRHGVPEKARRWYVQRVESFLDAVKPTALSALTADQMTDYLRQMCRCTDLADWQVRQIVDALRPLLVELAQVQTGKGVDWVYWREVPRVSSAAKPTSALISAIALLPLWRTRETWPGSNGDILPDTSG